MRESLSKKATLLIADRNHNVRNFLEREMTAAGYQVLMAKNGREVVKWAYCQDPPQLLVLDLDLPDLQESAVLVKIKDRIPLLPVILYTDSFSYETHSEFLDQAVFLEKREKSIEDLKQAVSCCLKGDTPDASFTNCKES